MCKSINSYGVTFLTTFYGPPKNDLGYTCSISKPTIAVLYY